MHAYRLMTNYLTCALRLWENLFPYIVIWIQTTLRIGQMQFTHVVVFCLT